ncbi:MAG TPA: (2Fe-2S)-binding protein [Gemmatimonadaceae bacterium]|nr:(2Fe-2S)-binding protein [Gemmatimonadaceae bacterium]
MRVRLNVNGGIREAEVPAGTSLLDVLRDDCGLTGARFGCGHGICGACVVLVDGQPTPACVTGAETVGDCAIVTVEGLSKGGDLHRVQQAFVDEDAMQCGACTSGMVMAAVALLSRTPDPSEDDVRAALAPHLCRCGVYLRAVRAVRKAAR